MAKEKNKGLKNIVADIQRQSSIPVPRTLSGPLLFSFKHLDTTNQKFGLSACKADRGDWAEDLLDKLRDVSRLSLGEFLHQGGNPKSLRSHPIAFAATSEASGFPILGANWKDSARQFQLSKSNGRVHGFLTGNTFFVVWLDPDHALYPSK